MTACAESIWARTSACSRLGLVAHAMKPSLQFRLSQHLTLTPQLQQSIRLLQLSTVELNQEIERLLMENPVLEREDGDEDARRRAARGRPAEVAAAPAAPEPAPAPRRGLVGRRRLELARPPRTTRTATAASPRPTRRRCATICAASSRSPTSASATAPSSSC